MLYWYHISWHVYDYYFGDCDRISWLTCELNSLDMMFVIWIHTTWVIWNCNLNFGGSYYHHASWHTCKCELWRLIFISFDIYCEGQLLGAYDDLRSQHLDYSAVLYTCGALDCVWYSHMACLNISTYLIRLGPCCHHYDGYCES